MNSMQSLFYNMIENIYYLFSCTQQQPDNYDCDCHCDGCDVELLEFEYDPQFENNTKPTIKLPTILEDESFVQESDVSFNQEAIFSITDDKSHDNHSFTPFNSFIAFRRLQCSESRGYK